MAPPRVCEEQQLLIDEEAGVRLHGSVEIPSKRLPTVTGRTNCNMAVTWYWTATTGVVLLVGTVLYIVAVNEWALFSWHPIFMSISFLSLTQGILVLQQTERKEEKVRGTSWHKLLQAIAFVTLVVGFVVVACNKIIKEKEHFRSLHAKSGLLLLIMIFGQAVVGYTALNMPGLYGGPVKAMATYKYHRISGYFVYALTLLTMLGGVTSGWATRNFDHIWVWVVAVLLVLIGIVPRVNPRKMKVRIGTDYIRLPTFHKTRSNSPTPDDDNGD